jgi:predicted small integral membrane protein
MLTRISKALLVAAAGFYLLLVALNNLTDYQSNYDFVFHVLSMDTTFPGNSLMWRSIHSPVIYHVFYAGIILWESVACVLLFAGAWKLWSARGLGAVPFNRAKQLATLGLTLNLLQWSVAFLSVGGEWFLMWQSKIWNGQTAAGRMFDVVALTLIFVAMRDDELAVDEKS